MFEGLMRTDHRTDADTLVFLREIDRRKIWAIEGYETIVKWCVRRGHMSESVAFKRLASAELAARFPAALALIRRGELHLSALNKLGKHLTEENHELVLARARGRTLKELDEIIAELAPQPDVAPSVRPIRAEPRARPEDLDSLNAPASHVSTSRLEGAPLKLAAPALSASTPPLTPESRPAPPKAKVTPTAPKRFKLEMTLSERGHEMLRELEGLLSHAGASLSEIVERGLDALLAQTKKKRAAASDRPRETQPREDDTRHVAASVQRLVWDEAGGRCTYLSPDGHRCESRSYLEVHHLEPYARGGRATIDNLALLCRVHNRLEGDREYGRDFMEAKIAESRVARRACHAAAGTPYS